MPRTSRHAPLRSAWACLRAAAKLVLGRGTRRSYGQYGEDLALLDLFRGKREGFYVEVGAYHPHLYSNTFLLYRRGWRGLCIDPNPDLAPLFKLFRPRDTFLEAGIGEGERSYKRFADGAYNRFEPGSGSLLRRLDDVLRERGVTAVDLLAIDAEGMDESVLATHDWSIRPAVVVVEAAEGDRTCQAVEARGYRRVATLGQSVIYRDDAAATPAP